MYTVHPKLLLGGESGCHWTTT